MTRVGRLLRGLAMSVAQLPILVILPVGLFVLCGVFAPAIAPYDPVAQDLLSANEGPSLDHLLGTDHLGRDTASRLVAGARTSLIAVTIILSSAMVLGCAIGVTSGFLGGIVDEIVMRVIDFGLSVPSLIVALAVIGVFGTGYWNMVMALTIAWIPIYARLSRGVVASAIHQPYIETLRVLGAHPLRILLRHLLPSAAGAVLVYASGDAGVLALAIATLSFLGLGVQPPIPEWGQMLVDALPYLEESPRQVLLPGAVLTLMVVGFNLLGETLALSKTPRSLSARALRRLRSAFAGGASR
jgi:peptide/nickel transport system permease protein